jgi:hypothetical protein
MFNPTKRLGDEEGDTGHTVIAVGIPTHKTGKFNPASRLGDAESEDAGEEDGDRNPDELMLQAAEGICKKLNVSTKQASGLKDLLESFFAAADSKPHDEGEHTDDDTGKEN